MVEMKIEKNITLYGYVKIGETLVKRMTQNFKDGEKIGGIVERLENEELYIQNIEECRNQEDKFIEEIRKIEDEYIVKQKELQKEDGGITLNEVEK